MYFMYQHEITWSNTLYPQYQVYKNRLNMMKASIDHGQFRYIKMKLTLQMQGYFSQEMEIL